MSKELYTKIREAVARGWYYPKNENKIMDVDLAEAISLEVHSMCIQLYEALTLANSMIYSGERHTEKSKTMIEQVLKF